MQDDFWNYDDWPTGEPYDWAGAARGDSEWDALDFHVDLGCGKLKKGRIGVDRYPAPGVNIVADLDALKVYGLPHSPGVDAVHHTENGPMTYDADGGHFGYFQSSSLPGRRTPRVVCFGLPFPDNSIESIISHHFFEHCGAGFVTLIDECYRVLRPGGLLRAITPLFPSRTAVEDPDHRRMFMAGTWQTFCGQPHEGGHWHESFSVPYTRARFEEMDKDMTAPVAPEDQWGDDDAREIRVALRAVK